jgi:predicted NAD-dependent protein-ADP-ribosyltransferase YbiA (DUF1768 family)
VVLAPPRDFLTHLPAQLPDGEPYYFLSTQQRSICARNAVLSSYVSHLPGWVPFRRIADALEYSHRGIENALQKCGGTPFVWGTEFENVHSLWHFDEPGFHADGRYYEHSEAYYHAQKPRPFSSDVWDTQRNDVMRAAVRYKFGSNPDLQALLVATHPHPLLSIKSHHHWGVDPNGMGENMLARVLMELRDDLVKASLRTGVLK